MNLKSGIVLLVFLLAFLAGQSQSDIRVTEDYTDKSVAWVLRDLKEKYKIVFAFDSQELSRITGSWTFKDLPIDQALSNLLENAGYDFMWSDDTCVIFPITKTERTQSPVEKTEEQLLLRGEIRDVVSGELLPFAAIASRSSGISTQSDADGKFQLDIPRRDADSLDVFFVGYERQVIAVNPVSEYVVIRMLAARNYLPDVLIQAENTAVFSSNNEASAQIINPQQTGVRFGTGESDVFRIAQILPGVSATLESSNGLVVRGSNADQTLINLDGFNIYHQDHMFGTFSAINSNAVKTIRLYKGCLPASIGGRTGGMMEMIGREGSMKRTKATVDISTLALGAVIESPLDSVGHGSVIITARKTFTNLISSPVYESLFSALYNTSLVTGGAERSPFDGENDPDFNFQDANVKFTWRPNKEDALNLSLYHSLDHLFIQYADTFSRELENVRDVYYSDESTKRNLGTSLRWVRSWNNTWSSHFLLATSRFTGSFFSGDTIRENLFQTDSLRFSSEENELKDKNFRFELHRKVMGNEWNGGLEWNSVAIKRKVNQQGDIQTLPDASSATLAFYLQYEYKLRNRLTVLPGVRIPYYNKTGLVYPEGRLSLRYELIPDKLQLKAFAGNMHQFIQRTQVQNLYLNTPDYWEIAGNNSLPVLDAYQSMAGFTWKSFLHLDAEFWYRRSKGSVLNVNQPQIVSNLLANQTYHGESEAYGVDIALRKDYKRHHLVLNYAWLNANAFVTELESELVPELFDQRHEIKCLYELRLKKWSLSGLWVWGSGRPYTPYLGAYAFELPDNSVKYVPLYGHLNTARLPQYARLDLSASYNFRIGKNRAVIHFSVYNVLNRKNVRDIQYLYRPFVSEDNVVSYNFEERKIPMLGLLPSINFSVSF